MIRKRTTAGLAAPHPRIAHHAFRDRRKPAAGPIETAFAKNCSLTFAANVFSPFPSLRSSELSEGCVASANPSAPAFFSASANGYCCVLTYPGDDVLVDPDGRLVRRDCGEDPNCAQLPEEVQQHPGVGVLPPGCEDVLKNACAEQATVVTLDDVDGDPVRLWEFACRLPSPDQDADGVGDRCDLCPFGFDPDNSPYVDASGMLWPNDGEFCNAEYSPCDFSPADGCLPPS